MVLIGEAASNSGSDPAPNGTAALAAGNEVVSSAVNGPAGIYVVAGPDGGGQRDQHRGDQGGGRGARRHRRRCDYALAGNRPG